MSISMGDKENRRGIPMGLVDLTAGGEGGGAAPVDPYILSPATATTLGGVKIGESIVAGTDGTIDLPNIGAGLELTNREPNEPWTQPAFAQWTDIKTSKAPTVVNTIYADSMEANDMAPSAALKGAPEGSRWSAGNTTGSLYVYTDPLKVKSISFGNFSGNYAPKNFVFEGSLNGTTWVSLGSFTVTTFGSPQTYTINSTEAYPYHRIRVTSSNSSPNTITINQLSIDAEIEVEGGLTLKTKIDGDTIKLNDEGKLYADTIKSPTPVAYEDVLGTPVFNTPMQESVTKQAPIQGFDIAGNYINVTQYTYTRRDYPSSKAPCIQFQSGYTRDEDKNVLPNSAVIIPYQLGQVLRIDTKLSPDIFFGQLLENGKFAMKAYATGSFNTLTAPEEGSSNGYTLYRFLTFSHTQDYDHSYSGATNNCTYIQVTADSAAATARTISNYFDSNYNSQRTTYLNIYTDSTASRIQKVNEITHCIVTGYATNTGETRADNFGLFSVEGKKLCTDISLSEINALPNLFDITAEQKTRNVRLAIDGQTIQLNSRGQLCANMDELGNEVNALSSRVTVLEESSSEPAPSGATYTAGPGIEISADNAISVSTTVPMGTSLNVTAVGSPAAPVNGIISTESNTSNYYTIDRLIKPAASDTWEFGTYFTFSSDASAISTLLGQVSANRDPGFQVDLLPDDNSVAYDLANTSSSWVWDNPVKTPIARGKWYYGVWKYDGAKIYQGIGETEDTVVFDSGLDFTGPFYMSSDSVRFSLLHDLTYNLGLASMDLTKTYWKINGEEVWRGITTGTGNAVVATTESLGLVKPDGTSIVVTEDGVISADYTGIANKPSIGNTTLIGDLKLSAPLSIQKNVNQSYKAATYVPATQTATFSISSGTFGTSDNYVKYYKFLGNAVGQEDGSFTTPSYIEFPYKWNDIIQMNNFNSNPASVNSWCALGYKTDKGFKPVLIRNYSQNQMGRSWFMATDWFIRYATLYYRRVDDAYVSTSFTPTSALAGEKILTVARLYYDSESQQYKLQQSVGASSGNVLSFDSSVQPEIAKIDSIRFFSTYVGVSDVVFVKDNSANLDLATCTREEIDALETIVPPEVVDDSTLEVGNWQQGYSALTEKPKLNGIELVGDTSLANASIQRALVPNAGIRIKQNSSWDLLSSTYDPDTNTITTNTRNVGNSTGANLQNSPGTAVDDTSLIPTKGVITPFFTNVTIVFGAGDQFSYNRLFLGTYKEGVFTPRAYINMGRNESNAVHKITKMSVVSEGSGFAFSAGSMGTTSTAAKGTRYYDVAACGVYINFDGVAYEIKYLNIPSNSAPYVIKNSLTGADAELLNQCNAYWILPNANVMCGTGYTKILPNDHTIELMHGDYNSKEAGAIEYLPDNHGSTFSIQIEASVDNTTIKTNDQGQLYADLSPVNTEITTLTDRVGALEASEVALDAYGIRGDYATRHGILDCPNGLIDYSINNKDLVINPGIILNCAGNGTAKTTIASSTTYTLTSPEGAITLFYADGTFLECGQVDYSTAEPADNGITNYQAWFNPDKTANPDQQWQFKSNDTGNVFRPVTSATPIADIVIGSVGVTSVSYIGYRVFDDDILPQLSDIENLQETTGALQTSIANIQTDMGGVKLVPTTQAEYDALTTKDPNTLYIIKAEA